MESTVKQSSRFSALEIDPEQFRSLGHQLVDRIAEFLASLSSRPVTPSESPIEVRTALEADRGVPTEGADPACLLDRAAGLLFNHSLFNSHPRFWGYITSSAAPIGALADLLASAVNPNVGAWPLSPIASEIEAQTIRWIAELLNYPADCGGLFVSGGNMANIVGFLAGRQAKAGHDVRALGVGASRLRVYCSAETHTWVQKAADIAAGDKPIMIIGAAGTVGTGAVDPLAELAALSREYNLWFHIDGAYGAMAAILPDAREEFAGLNQADSIAVDPHKWLYAPLEAGCALVRNREKLRDAFSYHPPYYHFETEATNYYDLGPQNSRGFRALKVWLALQQAGRNGYTQMIGDDIRLAAGLARLIPQYPELKLLTQNLSITTFRFVPHGLAEGSEDAEAYLNRLNNELLTRLQSSGEAYISNAVVQGKFALRACIVNFRTSRADVEALPPLVVRLGKQVDDELRPENSHN